MERNGKIPCYNEINSRLKSKINVNKQREITEFTSAHWAAFTLMKSKLKQRKAIQNRLKVQDDDHLANSSRRFNTMLNESELKKSNIDFIKENVSHQDKKKLSLSGDLMNSVVGIGSSLKFVFKRILTENNERRSVNKQPKEWLENIRASEYFGLSIKNDRRMRKSLNLKKLKPSS